MDFNELKKDHPEISDRLSKLEHEYKKSELLLEFAGHPSVRLLLEGLGAITEDINSKLLFKRELSLQERESLFVKRECFEWLRSQLEAAEDLKINTETKMSKL